MKIAILLPGQPRFTNDFNLLLNNLIGYDQADWFCYLTGNNLPSPVPEREVPLEWKNFDKDTGMLKLQSMLPPNNVIRSFELSDCDTASISEDPWWYSRWGGSLYKMWYNIYKVNQLRLNYEKENNIQYDMVIRVRSDIGFRKELDLSKIDNIQNNILIPINNWMGHPVIDPTLKYKICDLFAIGCSEHMNVYCDVIHKLKDNPFTQNQESWHPESNLGYHLVTNNIPFTKGNFNVLFRGYDIDL